MIILTGGAGFIGSNISDALVKDGHEVTVLDNLSTGKEENINPEVKFYNIDLLDMESLEFVFKEFKPDVVNHHAAQIDVRKSVEDPAFDAETNIIGSINLLRYLLTMVLGELSFPLLGVHFMVSLRDFLPQKIPRLSHFLRTVFQSIV